MNKLLSVSLFCSLCAFGVRADSTNLSWSADVCFTQEVARVQLTGFSLALPASGVSRVVCTLSWFDSSGGFVRAKTVVFPLQAFADALSSNGVSVAALKAAILRVSCPPVP